jgi:hypothetical protein
MHVLTTARRPPLFRRCECGRGVPRLHGEIAIHRGPVPPHPGVGCLIWMGATSEPRWLSAFGGDACACILYGGFGIRVVWHQGACILYVASGWFGRGRQMARVGVLGVVLGVMICASTRWILRCEICFRCVETVALDEMQRSDGAGARVGFVTSRFRRRERMNCRACWPP